MKTLSRLGSVAALALAVAGPTTLFAGPASASGHDPAPVFVQSDNLSGNTVTVYDRASDGTLTEGATVATGGKGGALTGAMVDHLASQGGLGYDADRGLLYAVNAGSDSLTTFLVNGDHLVRHQVLGTRGTFPASVTTRGDVVYVLNARDGGSIQGYRAVGRNLVAVPAWHRDLGLDPNATPEFTHTPGQVAFTPDGSRLLVTTKGNTSAIEVFDVSPSGAVVGRPDRDAAAQCRAVRGRVRLRRAGRRRRSRHERCGDLHHRRRRHADAGRVCGDRPGSDLLDRAHR